MERAMVRVGKGYFLPRGGRPFLRPRLKLLDRRVRRRVGKPLASWPHGETICWRPPPPLDLPCPPPFGWSTGFLATPREIGRRPIQRLRPALPSERLTWSPLPTTPIVARQRALTRRSSP